MSNDTTPRTPAAYRLLLADGSTRDAFVTDETEAGVPFFRARGAGWFGDVAADTAHGAALKVAAGSDRHPDGNGVGLPLVAILAPGEGRPAFGPDLAARLAASPLIQADPLLHALRAHLANGADVAEVVAEVLLGYAEIRRHWLEEVQRVALRDAATLPVTLASLASHDPELARAVFGIDINRTPETR